MGVVINLGLTRGGKTAPHGDPETVRQFLFSHFTRSCLDQVLEPGGEAVAPRIARRRPGQQAPQKAEALALRKCLDEEVNRAESVLFAEPKQKEKDIPQGCRYCHMVELPTSEEARYRIVVPNGQPDGQPRSLFPQPWFPHSTFAHDVHARAGETCQDCHAEAAKSEKREDLLLPDLASCQTCHSTSGGARDTCVTCHGYHRDSRSTSR